MLWRVVFALRRERPISALFRASLPVPRPSAEVASLNSKLVEPWAIRQAPSGVFNACSFSFESSRL